ncbi:Y-family DNA polymerase [Salinicola acroporae]|uniref:DNA polymerase V subunit UmuC n=1 Tax=Salinicola acroporae TaxID=1541440 RepID=A0ABT6I456_9GAMM|nr:Y-family DNA polymerase [Salinicola acroporae]MDH4572483.1 DNA polymerase V subunit UmuC [Salinicola acroporae]
MIGLVDCNNFYASCERVFRPDWGGRPIAVLSNNDGCVIARSNEAKELVEMGAPTFKIPPAARRELILVSSNYTLYGDMSRRVTATLREFTPYVEIYSIDESFLGFEGFPVEQLEDHCQRLRYVVRRNTGIPVSVGLSTSRTLAKAANRLAKKIPAYEGVCLLQPDSDITRQILEDMPVTDLWGVSGRLGQRLAQMGIVTAWQLREADPKRIRSRFSVVQERLVYELRGIDCIDTDDYGEPKKNIMTSRSFGRLTSDRHEVEQAIRAHAARGAEKLRKQGSVARAIQVHLKTNKHREDLAQYHPALVVQLPHPSNDTRVIVGSAQAALTRIYRGGYRYMKAGVMMLDLCQSDSLQHDIFDSPESDAERERSAKASAVMDELNRRMGLGTVRLGGTKGKADWKLKAELLTQRYTTRWDELPVAKL